MRKTVRKGETITLTDMDRHRLSFRDHSERLSVEFETLRDILARAKENSEYYRRTLADVDPAGIQTMKDLAKLPLLRKSELPGIQAENPPLGGINTVPLQNFSRIYSSPGPINEPELSWPDYWRSREALFAAGFTPEDRILNCFAYHGTPAGFMLDSGAIELGCLVYPGGTGNTEGQARAIQTFGLTGYTGTPDFLKVILQAADKAGIVTTSLTKALFTGGYLSPELIEFYASRGITSFQCFGTADLGIVAYESKPGDGMIVCDGVLIEILDPVTGLHTESEKGDLVITSLTPEYPLIRFMTGDLSRILPGISQCGRTNTRIAGWLGRSDESVKVKGMFIRPGQIRLLMSEFPGIKAANLTVGRKNDMDSMALLVHGANLNLDEISAGLQRITGMKGQVTEVAPDKIDSAKTIIDLREQQK